MTMSELMAVMTGGFATVAGGVLAAYVGMLKDVVPNIAGHLIAASVMSAPARGISAYRSACKTVLRGQRQAELRPRGSRAHVNGAGNHE